MLGFMLWPETKKMVTDRMLVLSEHTYAVLDQQAELLASYAAVIPVPDQYAFSAPFPAQNSAPQGSGDAKKRIRKRKRAAVDQEQEQATPADVHTVLASRLSAALAGFQAWLNHPAQLCASVTAAYAAQDVFRCIRNTAAGLAASQPPALDCISMASLVQTLRAKLTWISQQQLGQPASLFGTLHTNDSEAEALALAHESAVVIPRQAAFMLGDLKGIKALVKDVPAKFDLLVIDPPWENASARRSGKYQSLPSRFMLGIPVPSLLAEGGLVALWMTNRPRLWRFVETELLPAWQLRIAATWAWMKVSAQGQLLGRLDCQHRRPYELVLLLQSPGSPRSLPDGFCLFATPGEHSRKPGLGSVLSQHLPPQPRRGELFARELRPGWTSWGNDCLRFQTLDRFTVPGETAGSQG